MVRMRESNTVDPLHHLQLRGTKWDQAREIATLSIHDLTHGHLFELIGLRFRCQRHLPWTLLRHKVISVVRQDVLSEPEFLLSNCVQTMSSLHVPQHMVPHLQYLHMSPSAAILSKFVYFRSTGERITEGWLIALG